MKKILCLFLLIFYIGSLFSCNINQNPDIVQNEPYEDVKNLAADVEFNLHSNLDPQKAEYPLSTGKVYYVSSDGNDENDGLSISSPLKTLAAVSKLELIAGDSVLFKKGDTFEGKLTLSNLKGEKNNPITFASYGELTEMPIITNTKKYATSSVFTFVNSSNLVIRDLSFEVYGMNRNTTSSSTCSTGINFQYNHVGDETFEGIYVYNNKLVGKSINDSYEAFDTNSSGIVFMTLEETHDGSPLNMFNGAYIRYNEVSYFGRVGIQCGGWIQEKGGQNEMHRNKYLNLHFDNNVVHHIGGIGMYIAAGKNSTMNRNHIYETGITTDKSMIEGQCGMMYLSAEYSSASFNVIHDCYDANTGWDAMGIDIDWNTDHIEVSYNYIYNCQGSGIGTMANQNCSIKYNRIENCRGETTHDGSITISNFTNRQYPVPDDFHSVTNLIIDGNLIWHSEIEKPVFHVYEDNGDKDYVGNEFINNRVVFVGNTSPKNLVWVNVEPTLNWYKFANNKYYSTDNSQFKAFESTPKMNINFMDGAQVYEVTKEKLFDSWAKRDLNSTYSVNSNYIPAKPINCNATLDGNKLILTWDSTDKDNVWHYNIYKVQENESASYLNLIGQVEDLKFEYMLENNETYYYIIQPESNEGIYGKALKVKISLE